MAAQTADARAPPRATAPEITSGGSGYRKWTSEPPPPLSLSPEQESKLQTL